MRFLRFESEGAAQLAFGVHMVAPTFEGQQIAFPSSIGGVAVDVIGAVWRPTGEMTPGQIGPIPVFELLPGFHINLSSAIDELSPWEVEPEVPARVFAALAPVAGRVPVEVARWQAKLALMQSADESGVSLWERMLQLRSAINDTESAVMMDAALNETLNWRRTSPTVEWAASQLGLTAEQVDQLFIQAAALEL